MQCNDDIFIDLWMIYCYCCRIVQIALSKILKPERYESVTWRVFFTHWREYSLLAQGKRHVTNLSHGTLLVNWKIDKWQIVINWGRVFQVLKSVGKCLQRTNLYLKLSFLVPSTTCTTFVKVWNLSNVCVNYLLMTIKIIF